MSEERHEGARLLFEFEMELWKVDLSKLRYDEERDYFLFANGHFAFSRQGADWKLLRERGYAT